MIDFTGFRKIWSLLDPKERRNAWIVLGVVIVAALGAALMVGSIVPFLTILADPSRIREVGALRWAYERGGFESDYAFLIAIGIVTLVVIVSTNLLQLLRAYAITRYAQMRAHSLSRKLLALYLQQPYAFFLDHHSSQMSTRILTEAEQAVTNYLSPAAELVASILTIGAVLALLILVDPAVALSVFVAFGGTFGVIYLLVRRRLSRLGPARAAANQERFKAAKEVLGGIKEVKLHRSELGYLARYSKASVRMARASIAASLIRQLPTYLIQSIALGGMVILCLVLLDPLQLENGRALGDLLPVLGVIAFSAQRLMPEFGKVYGSLTRMKFGVAAVDVIYEDFQKQQVHGPASDLRDGTRLGLTRQLDLEQVSYRYPNATEKNLSEVSLAIRAGERIGIVGSTGAGKTTLADVILGLLIPTDGRMAVDGTEIHSGNMHAWQAAVAYVPQDIFLMDASIAENIAFGIPAGRIDRARVEAIAKIAQLDGFVRSDLPEGFDTEVGERGVRLSGGQRQRIGIARALYNDADLIVFDEATSALDNLTEREVMAAVDALPGDKTVLMIAHRLSTVKKCDRIIVMEKGRVVGIGPWSDLIAHNDAFQRIARAA